MPPAVRLADICTGHGPCPPRPNVQASTNVYINNRGAHRKGDLWGNHCSHTTCAARGSQNVYTNNRDQERVKDPVVCGSYMATGSMNVIVN